VEIIRGAGRHPVRRDTLYGVVEDYGDHNPPEQTTLVTRSPVNAQRISTLTMTAQTRRRQHA
jgi:hypothetical protein